MENQADARVSVKDAYRELLKIQKNMKFGGLGAIQLEELREVDWAKMREGLKAAYSNQWLVINILALALFVLAYFLVNSSVRSYFLVGTVFCLVVIFRRGGEHEGFEKGYADGFENGINKTLNLSDSESAEASKVALEIKVAEGVVRRFDIEDEGHIEEIRKQEEVEAAVKSAGALESSMNEYLRVIENEMDANSEYRKKEQELSDLMLEEGKAPQERIDIANSLLELVKTHRSLVTEQARQINSKLWNEIKGFEGMIGSISDEVFRKKMKEWASLSSHTYNKRVIQLDTLINRAEHDSFLPRLIIEEKGNSSFGVPLWFVEKMKIDQRIIGDAIDDERENEALRSKLSSLLLGKESLTRQ